MLAPILDRASRVHNPLQPFAPVWQRHQRAALTGQGAEQSLLFDTAARSTEPRAAASRGQPGQAREISELRGIPVPLEFC